jgi:hypothetical protein
VTTEDTRLLFRVLLSILEALNASVTMRRELLKRIEALVPVPVPPVGKETGGTP